MSFIPAPRFPHHDHEWAFSEITSLDLLAAFRRRPDRRLAVRGPFPVTASGPLRVAAGHVRTVHEGSSMNETCECILVTLDSEVACGRPAQLRAGVRNPCCGAQAVFAACERCFEQTDLSEGVCRYCESATPSLVTEPVRLRAA